jgi:hypothetical protein
MECHEGREDRESTFQCAHLNAQRRQLPVRLQVLDLEPERGWRRRPGRESPEQLRERERAVAPGRDEEVLAMSGVQDGVDALAGRPRTKAELRPVWEHAVHCTHTSGYDGVQFV